MRCVIGCCLLASSFAAAHVAHNREGVVASVAERVVTCTPTPPVTVNADGTLTAFGGRMVEDGRGTTLLDGPVYIPDGEYARVTAKDGYLTGATPMMGPPNGCTTIISTDNDGNRTVDCKKNGCTEPCGKVTEIHADGTVVIYCGCNLAVPTPSPAPSPAPAPPTPNPGPGPSPN